MRRILPPFLWFSRAFIGVPIAAAMVFDGAQPTLNTGQNNNAQSSSVVFIGQQPTAQRGVIAQAAGGSVLYNGQQPTALVTAKFSGQGTSGTIILNGQQPSSRVGSVVQAISDAILFDGRTATTTTGIISTAQFSEIVYTGNQPSFFTLTTVIQGRLVVTLAGENLVVTQVEVV